MDNVSEIANKMMLHLEGLNKPAINAVMEWIEKSIENVCYLSNPKERRNS